MTPFPFYSEHSLEHRSLICFFIQCQDLLLGLYTCNIELDMFIILMLLNKDVCVSPRCFLHFSC